jgi:large subunit ribosomal protein L16
MFQPKKTKFKKYHKGRLSLKTNALVLLNYGVLGLKCLETGRITSSQIESFRQNITRKIKKTGKLWINIFPDLPITSKPSEIRMGKGKGNIDHWVAKVSPGKILFEIMGNKSIKVKFLFQILKSASHKLPVKTAIILK